MDVEQAVYGYPELDLGDNRSPLVEGTQAGSRPGHYHPVVVSLAWLPVLAIAAVVALVLLLTSGRVGYFCDELYFLVAGFHLDWGYVDQGPLTPLLTRAMNAVFPGSLAGERLPATLLTAAGVIVAAAIARELGGKCRAQVLTAGAYAMASVAEGHLLTTGTIDRFLWVLTTWLLVRWVRLRDDRLLLWLGLVTAVALQNKWLITSFWGIITICVLAAGPRELLGRPLLWLSAGFVTIATSPALLWQAHHGWPQLAMAPVIGREDDLLGGRWTFIPLMLMAAGVGTGIALFCYGTWRLLRSPNLRPYRFLGYAFVGVVTLFLVADGRFMYAAGFQALLFAAGAVELQRREPARWWRWTLTWPTYVLSAMIALSSLPVLPVSWPTPARPFSLAMLGWPELTGTVAGAYRVLQPTMQRTTAVVADAYWDASALDRYGPARGLPHPLSPHRGYWYFGAPTSDVNTVLYLGAKATYLHRYFTDVRQVATVRSPVTSPFVGPIPLWLCRGPRAPWLQLWSQLRHL
jgi:Dolichyl-phosphate-mannose-protein mannosyltransferase